MGFEQEKDSWLQMRMSNEEKLQLAAVADEYGVSLSAMVRMMIAYFADKKPVVSVKFSPKADAPALEPAIAQ